VASRQPSGLSLAGGTTFVALGVIVNLAAAVKHWHTVRQIERGKLLRFRPVSLGTVVACLLTVIGTVDGSLLDLWTGPFFAVAMQGFPAHRINQPHLA
jgi:hypothetical protein